MYRLALLKKSNPSFSLTNCTLSFFSSLLNMISTKINFKLKLSSIVLHYLKNLNLGRKQYQSCWWLFLAIIESRMKPLYCIYLSKIWFDFSWQILRRHFQRPLFICYGIILHNRNGQNYYLHFWPKISDLNLYDSFCLSTKSSSNYVLCLLKGGTCLMKVS
jgi:hypothetical protein